MKSKTEQEFQQKWHPIGLPAEEISVNNRAKNIQTQFNLENTLINPAYWDFQVPILLVFCFFPFPPSSVGSGLRPPFWSEATAKALQRTRTLRPLAAAGDGNVCGKSVPKEWMGLSHPGSTFGTHMELQGLAATRDRDSDRGHLWQREKVTGWDEETQATLKKLDCSNELYMSCSEDENACSWSPSTCHHKCIVKTP